MSIESTYRQFQMNMDSNLPGTSKAIRSNVENKVEDAHSNQHNGYILSVDQDDSDDDANRHRQNGTIAIRSQEPNTKCHWNNTIVDISDQKSRDVQDTEKHVLDKDSNSTQTKDLSTQREDNWGWVIVFGSFMCHLIADGCAFSFGVLYIELLDYFRDSKSKTAWVGSLFVSIPLIMGPIASAITTKYGCRATTIAGGLIAGAGFIASSQANNIETLCVTFGVIAGLGLSMVYVAAIVIVVVYFDRKRALATGVAVAGSGIGTFLFAPLTDFLIDEYGWRGALLVTGGIVLNIAMFGLLFRPHTGPHPHTKDENEVNGMQDEKNILNNNVKCETQSLVSFSTYNTMPPKEESSLDQDLLDFVFKDTYALLNKDTVGKEPVIKTNRNILTTSNNFSQFIANMKDNDLTRNGQNAIRNGDIVRSRRYAFASCPNISIEDDAKENDDKKGNICCRDFARHVTDEIQESLDTQILQSVVFSYFCCSTFLLYIGYDVPYVFTPDKAIEMGISEEKASFLVSIMGITSTLGQIAIGYVSDMPQVNIVYLYAILTSLAGISTIFVPWYYNYAWLSTFAGVYGFCISANYVLTSILLVNLFGMNLLTSAYGFEMLAQGIANLIGPPLAGWITDELGSYDMTFIVNGCVMMVSGIMIFALPKFIRCDKVIVQTNDNVIIQNVHA